MAGGRRKGSRTGAGAKDADRRLVEMLRERLSDEEVEALLGRGLLALEEAGEVDRLVRKLDGDTGKTVRAILAARRKRSRRGPPAPGDARVLQDWETAWRDWRRCVDETGDEEGRYVYRENSWEAPYPDPGTFEEDLEEIAKRVRPLIPVVVGRNLDPGFSFVEAVRESSADLGSGLPDWMEADADWRLGPGATLALLEWEWATAMRDGRDAFDFADRVRSLDDAGNRLEPDGDTVVEFVCGLGPPHDRRILEGMRERAGDDPWRVVLEDRYSPWFAVHMDLSRRLDRGRYLEICAASVDQDWRLSLPVLRKLLREGRPAEARALAEKAGASMAGRRDGPWDPRRSLLAPIGDPLGHGTGKTRMDLLALWRKALVALGDEETGAALQVQIVVSQDRQGGDSFLASIRAVEGRFPATADRLFGEWRRRVAQESDPSGFPYGTRGEEGWVPFLADAARGGDPKGEALRAALRRWLASAEESAKSLDREQGRVAVLTLDLDHGGRLAKASPPLRRVLVSRVACGGRPDTRSWRRRALKRFGAQDLLDEVLDFWRRNAVRMVPDPARQGAPEYAVQVDWLAAVRDLDAPGYAALVEEWRVTHRRRRNLWKALRARRLPFPEP